MRVLLVSPAAPSARAGVAGGIAGYVADLARSLVAAGCEVGVVSSGHVYRPSLLGLGGGVGRCRAEELDAIDGVRRFQIVNSPVLAPSLWQFGGPEDEASNGVAERVFGRVCSRFRPDVVHIHGFEGLSAGIVGVAKRGGARVFFSVHNYHAFCPQVYLLRGRREPCVDYDGGRACETCEGRIDLAAERRRRASGGGEPPAIEPPERSPVMTFEADGSPTAATRELWGSSHRLWKPIDDGLPEPGACELVHGRYGERRRAFVSALNGCDSVLAVSLATAAICGRMGVRDDLVRAMPIGSWAAGVDDGQRPGPPEPGAHLRLVFLGFGSYPKGLGVLCDALLLLTAEVRARVAVSAHGVGVAEEMTRLDPVRAEFARVECGGRYERGDVARLLAGADAVVVPSVWHDNGPQTAIEARALGVPVIGSRIGGIPDIVAEGIDGLLFRANDRADLARVIAGVVRESGRLAAIRRTIRPWITMPMHAASLVELYGSALSSAADARGTEQV